MSFLGGSPQPALSASQIYQYALNAGFTGSAAVTATAIGLAESSGIPNNFNPADSHGGSVGLMQINGANANLLGGSNWLTNGQDPQQSMDAAYQLYSNRGSFTDWGAFNNGSYASNLGIANDAASNYTSLDTGGVTGGGSGTAFDSLNPTISSETNPLGSEADAAQNFNSANSIGANMGYPAQGESANNPYGQFGTGTTGDSAVIPGVNSPTVSPAVSPSSATPVTGQSQSPSPGTPIYISDPAQIGETSAQTIATATTNSATALNKGLGALGTSIQTTENSAAVTGTSWLQDIFSAGQNLFVRSGFVILGLVILAGAFAFFYLEGKSPSLAAVA